MKTIKFLTIITAITVAFMSCTKDGATGPAGPAGANGNANVTNGQASINSSNWTWTGSSYTCTINSTNITSNLISSGGAVEVYISPDNGAGWVALSYTYINPSVFSPNAFMSYAFVAGQVELVWTWNNQAEDGDPCTTYGTSLLVNIVAIPASIMLQNPNINWKDANEAAQFPGIKAILNTTKQ